jgi:hypothetical protein
MSPEKMHKLDAVFGISRDLPVASRPASCGAKSARKK